MSNLIFLSASTTIYANHKLSKIQLHQKKVDLHNLEIYISKRT